jgi:hypothetical protein
MMLQDSDTPVQLLDELSQKHPCWEMQLISPNSSKQLYEMPEQPVVHPSEPSPSGSHSKEARSEHGVADPVQLRVGTPLDVAPVPELVVVGPLPLDVGAPPKQPDPQVGPGSEEPHAASAASRTKAQPARKMDMGSMARSPCRRRGRPPGPEQAPCRTLLPHESARGGPSAPKSCAGPCGIAQAGTTSAPIQKRLARGEPLSA